MIVAASCSGLDSRRSSESRNKRAVGYPSDDAPAAFYIPPSPLLSRIQSPPEAPSEESWARFAEEADEGLCWSPNPAAPGRLSDEESFILETRGTTSQIQDSQPPVCSGDDAHAAARPKSALAQAAENMGGSVVALPEACRVGSQQELWRRQTVHKNSIAAKLREAGATEEAQKLESCHSRYVVAICGDCGSVQKFPNRCDQGHCPECQPSLARERERQVGWWSQSIKQPKHVVLTLRNIPTLTPGHLAEAKKYLARLRRTAFCGKTTVWWFDRATGNYSRLKSWRTADSSGYSVKSSPWRGGFYSIEVTKEDKGWHLHFHLLVDSDFIAQTLLAEAWRRITFGYSYIVKVKDCRQDDYLREVTKYAVKGSQLAKWSPAEIVMFLQSFANARTFGVFGSLYGARTEFAEFIATMKSAKPKCTCGSCNVRYMDENLWLAEDCRPCRLPPARPPPPPAEDPSFPFALAHRHD